MANHKIERISSDISRIISDILASVARDSLLKTITITGFYDESIEYGKKIDDIISSLN